MEDLKAAEQRGYSRGYNAGRKKAKQDRGWENIRRERQAFLDKAFIACLQFAAEQQGWKKGDNPIRTVKERVALAADFANEALKQRPLA